MGSIIQLPEAKRRRAYGFIVEDFVSRRPSIVSKADMFTELEQLEMSCRATEALIKVVGILATKLDVAQTSSLIDLTHTRRCLLEVISDDLNLTPEAWAVLVAEGVLMGSDSKTAGSTPVASNATPRYIMDIKWGSIEMAVPTGRWIEDAEGWWSMEHTPTRYLDAYGHLEREEPFDSGIRMTGFDSHQMALMGGVAIEHPTQIAIRAKRWWKFRA